VSKITWDEVEMETVALERKILIKERDRYKKALEGIFKIMQYHDEDSLFTYIENNLDDVIQDYCDVVSIVKHALDGDDV
jgi:hypothetical protein